MKKLGFYAGFALFVSLGIGAANGQAQAGEPPHIGIPQDWTMHHLAFTRDGVLKHPDVLKREPRVLLQAAQRWQQHSPATVSPAGPQISSSTSAPQDWNVSLGTGRIAANMYPAKYGYDPAATPSCTGDFIIFGLATVGTTGGQANLVAYNNLYSGTSPTGMCGTAPTVMFAYNISTVAGGRISTSPVLSLDGTQIAFVESSPNGTGQAIFHVVTWAANPGQGTVAASAAPPTMTSLTYSPTTNSTTSSPWIDYGTDTAYVGADNGRIYKIHPVFTGTPALVTTAPWPVTVSNNLRLTAPVVDTFDGYIMVGSANGNLYQVNLTTGALKSLAIGVTGQRNPGVLAPPIVDVTNGVTFAVSANDATSGVLVEADTLAMTQIAKGRIGVASASGTTVSLYQPALSNDYYNNPVTGVVRTCGTGAATIEPWQYSFGFTIVNNKVTMNSAPSFSQQLLTSTAARCTGWVEFFNPSIGAGTDLFFFGLTTACVAGGGCVASTTGDTAANTAALSGGPSGIVVDNYSTASQASSIYMSARGVNRGYKFTQSGLAP